MQKKYKLKLKLKLTILYGSLIATALFVLGFITFNNAKRILFDKKIQQLNLVVDLKSSEIHNFIQSLEKQMRIVQNYYSVKFNFPTFVNYYHDPNSEEYIRAQRMLDDQMTTLLRELNLHNVLFFNLEGEAIYSLNKQQRNFILGSNLQDKDDIVFEEGKIDIYFSKIFKSLHSENEYSMLLLGPIYDFNGQLLGVVAFEIDMNPVYQVIQDSKGLGKSGEIAVGRREGDHVLFLHNLKYDTRAAFEKKVYYGDKNAMPIQLATQGKSGSGLTKDYRGEPIIASWRPIYIGENVLGLVAKIDQKEEFLIIEKFKKGFLIILWVTILLSIGIIFINATTITGPIEQLRLATSQVAAGQMSISIDNIHTKDEVGDLACDLREMAARLRKTTVSRDELIQEVQRRKEIAQMLSKMNTDLERVNRIMMGREKRIIELKQIINGLNRELGKKEPYSTKYEDRA